MNALDAFGRANNLVDAGPELVTEVRNKLVHPPRRLNGPEWPSPDVIIEAWELSMWYLELVLLRVLEYSGSYTSRITAKAYGDTSPVPWEVVV
jgi:hypothetical protein